MLDFVSFVFKIRLGFDFFYYGYYNNFDLVRLLVFFFGLVFKIFLVGFFFFYGGDRGLFLSIRLRFFFV